MRLCKSRRVLFPSCRTTSIPTSGNDNRLMIFGPYFKGVGFFFLTLLDVFLKKYKLR